MTFSSLTLLQQLFYFFCKEKIGSEAQWHLTAERRCVAWLMCDPSDHSLLIMFIPCDFCNPHLWFLIFYSFCSQLFPAATLIVRNKTQTFFCFVFFNIFPLCVEKKRDHQGENKTTATSHVSLKQTPRRNGGVDLVDAEGRKCFCFCEACWWQC